MLILAVILFGIAALLGLTMAVMVLQRKLLPPLGLAIAHGIFAALGLLLLLIAVLPGFSGAMAWALLLFVLAALGGFIMALGYHRSGKLLPSFFVAAHGLLAVIAFIILLRATFAA